MTFKKATLCGLLSYCFVFTFTRLSNNYLHIKLFFFNTHMPLWIILAALIFGAIYIRSIHEYEIFEGFMAGVYFAIIAIIIDIIYLLLTTNHINFGFYFTKIAYIYILYPIIITSLGYLANFEVQLK